MTAAAHSPAVVPLGPAPAWILRAGTAACFIGHGSLGLFLYKAATGVWPSYFAVVGIGHDTALTLMPWVGVFDVAMALTVLFYPLRWLVLYMTAWCVWTALLRPLAGESFWEAVERAGNYGAPLGLLFLMTGARRFWQRSGYREAIDESRLNRLAWVLRLTTVLLLLGHGMLNWIVQKPMFVAQYNLIGLSGNAVEPVVGVFECLLALAVLLKPNRRLLLGVVIWKLASEALCPMAGSPIWVFVEHGGSYAAPLALAFLVARTRTPASAATTDPTPASAATAVPT